MGWGVWIGWEARGMCTACRENLLGKIHLKDPGDWLAGSLGSRMRVCDVDGTGLAFPRAGFGRGYVLLRFLLL